VSQTLFKHIAINLNVANLFSDSSFTFLTMLNDILYQFMIKFLI